MRMGCGSMSVIAVVCRDATWSHGRWVIPNGVIYGYYGCGMEYIHTYMELMYNYIVIVAACAGGDFIW